MKEFLAQLEKDNCIDNHKTDGRKNWKWCDASGCSLLRKRPGAPPVFPCHSQHTFPVI